ncbi:MAG: type VI secretion system tip protein VgrG [Gammaproteobacteria bacterium]|nr:type VI secretion system tip protein VgrG [Gammaproteobacteria bacterium]
MANSPDKDSDGVIKLTIFSEGSKLDDAIKIVDVIVQKSVNAVPLARFTVLDGDMPEKDFPISDTDDLAPGKKIKINAGYKDKEETIFEGIVVKHNVKITGDNYSRLHIECRDNAVAMTIGRKNSNFIEVKDSEVITDLIGGYSDLSASVEDTATEHKELVQYYCTDWDFMLSRAEVSGLIVIVDDNGVSVAPPEVDGESVLKVTYGQDLKEFHAEIDARHQYKEVKGACWDPGTQAVVEQVASSESLNEQGDLDSATLSKVIGLDSFRLQTPTMMETTALKDWAESQQIKSGLSRITGSMKFQGSAKVKPGTLVEIEGVGSRFSGNVFVSQVVHEIVEGNWISEVKFGMSADWFAEKRDLSAPITSGLVPGVQGLQIGIVMKLDEDPEGQNKIQVKIPLLQAETEGVWARLASYYASEGIGEFFIPEIGDEVVLGYLNNDPAHPIILGSLYSSQKQPPYPLTADNFIKAIVTKSELKVEFDDEKKVITIVTPGENKIVISDEDKSILITDQSANKVELSDSGIVMDSPKDITLSAQGKISLDAMGEISISSQADFKTSGLNIEHNANVGLTAKGGASAEISAGGNTTVKGAMVMIN